jgi:hypothetical protein
MYLDEIDEALPSTLEVTYAYNMGSGSRSYMSPDEAPDVEIVRIAHKGKCVAGLLKQRHWEELEEELLHMQVN